ncbi:MAG TPA: histidine phosphatase family protein [Alphaproteobacteria bacterium]|nr:histidine phosphatase family protein [Alphaproteobacteria bacterium]
MILIRHGQSEFNVVYGETRQDPGIEDPKLTDTGRAQARALGPVLRALGVARLLVSPYTRTLETAALLRESHDVPVTIEPIVRERAAFSCDVGSPRDALAARWPEHIFDHLDDIWWSEHEESDASLRARGHSFRRTVARDGGWHDIAVVTHWGFIKALTGLTVGNCVMVRFDPTGSSPPAELVPAPQT